MDVDEERNTTNTVDDDDVDVVFTSDDENVVSETDSIVGSEEEEGSAIGEDSDADPADEDEDDEDAGDGEEEGEEDENENEEEEIKGSKSKGTSSRKKRKTATAEPKNCGEKENDYFKKFTKSTREAIIANYHPEIIIHNATEVKALTHIVRMADGTIDDLLHRTLPFLTKFEKTRVLGQRARQLNDGAPICCPAVPDNIIDNYLIAEMELKLKVLPFIIRRPLPNGGSEYWNIKDLELI
jgi:DNA-directed RNA polymerase subunit K/omega